MGLKGVLLAALFGAIQSTVSAVINSTSTIVTLDLYKRFFRPQLSEDHSVSLGRWASGSDSGDLDCERVFTSVR